MIREYDYQSTVTDNSFHVTIGKVAEQANGECLVQAGDTVVLTTAVASREAREGQDFFPLTCDYQEKLYAVGRIPGGYVKREGRGSQEATLNARQMDRPLRPLFPEGFVNEVQIIATVLSVSPEDPPEICAMNGSSIALSTSDIPFHGPTGSVIVGYVDGEYVINPSEALMERSELNLTVSGTEDAIMMVEAGANELSEDVMLGAILYGHEEIKSICRFIKKIVAEIGKEKMEYTVNRPDEQVRADVEAYAKAELVAALRTDDKMVRAEREEAIRKDTFAHFEELDAEAFVKNKKNIQQVLDDIVRDEVRRLITVDKVRADGRAMDEIRPLSAEVGLLPRVHGSGLFKRGQTQVLSVVTLGGPRDVLYIDGLHQEEIVKSYFHQYNFPPFSVGDVKPMRSPGRREIGHGNLAERALLPVLPDHSEFPYTIRVVSEVLSSNGSSSQASICGSTLSLMDAGVPIKAPVAGIAMGLIKEGEHTAILTDIQGLEDHLGDMDFKVAGTAEGITALQMDIKIEGIDQAIMETALTQAKKARFEILDVLHNAIAEPRKNLSKYAPRILSLDIDPDKIRDVIGKGGKTINEIISQTGAQIDTEDDGHITILSVDGEGGERAMKMIQDIVREVEVGDVYEGTVSRILKFGAFVDIGGGKEGMIHISKLEHHRVEKVEDVVNIGDKVKVKVIEVDDQGRINLSRKDLLPKNTK
ncbi:MAG: polyribonucleotide nucleotidyltransferase [Peptoniphilaceae bacterium]|nr:polyribonucleotide nucleotidyltransferase [Peptoniphilaceae bacterium]MDY5766319.1 polyribonucleotide nucleotidyltransferase [Peptoniphilaceae bacterium]MDY6146253.1 polyribonucleotide nucleotidyltransferase [Peptoniphilaceae bacterium]